MFWGRQIGIAHSKVDNILSPSSSLQFELAYDVKDVGRQTGYSGKLSHEKPLILGLISRRFPLKELQIILSDTAELL